MPASRAFSAREETEIISPLLDELRGEGFDLDGPLPADTLFNPRRLKGCDCVLAMYHDQGLPVLKYASFGAGVNVTLGLPIIRTSVDHGTALDLAGTGRAESGSLVEAIQLAARLAAGHRRDAAHRMMAAQGTRLVMRHIPRKRFGQNFLVDEAAIAAIVAAIAPQPRDRLVEIGPGLGALTRPLSGRLEHLHAIEIDRDIIARLRAELPAARVTLHEGDALRFDFSALGPRLRVVGNLPYNISTPLLFHLAQHAAAIFDIHVMLQKEVVERMVAAPSTAEYGRLSVMLQYRFEMEKLLDVPPAAFRPAPKVESAVVRMTPFARLPHPARDEALFGKSLPPRSRSGARRCATRCRPTSGPRTSSGSASTPGCGRRICGRGFRPLGGRNP